MQVIAARLEELGMDVMRATDTASMQAVEEAAPTLDFLLLPIRGVDGAGMVHIPRRGLSGGNHIGAVKAGRQSCSPVCTPIICMRWTGRYSAIMTTPRCGRRTRR